MKNIIIVIAVVLVGWIGYSMIYPRQKTPSKTENNAPAAEAPAAAVVVAYENNAFNPGVLNVKAGTTVTFRNNGVSAIRIPSGPHPVHTSFPEFDSDTLQPGESYNFTFTNPMTLKYHNHYNPEAKGQVIVE